MWPTSMMVTERFLTIRIDNEILINPSDAVLGKALQQAVAERE